MMERHHLIFPAPDVSFKIHSVHEDQQKILNYVSEWINKGLPCIYTRQLIKDALKLNAGLPVVIAGKKYRIAISLNHTEIKKQKELPKLIEMTPFLAQKLNGNSITFSEHDQLKFQSISVYGSFLFEYLSNQPFVNHHSDLDLLIPYEHESLSELNQKISRLKALFQIPIDGEIRFKNLGDIALKELTNPVASQFLFKNTNEIGLISRHDLYQQFPDLHGH